MAFHEYDFKVKFTNKGIQIGYFKDRKRPIRPSDALWIIPMIAILILIFVFVMIPYSDSEAEMRDAFNAFKTGNAEAWAESVHPDYYEALGDLDALSLNNIIRSALHGADYCARLHFILWWASAHLHHSILPDTKSTPVES